jgi:hypothetical protein
MPLGYEQSTSMESIVASLRKMGGVTLTGANTEPASERLGNWRLEAERIAWLTGALRHLAEPYVDAAIKEVPVAHEPDKKRNYLFGDTRPKKGGRAWEDTVRQKGHTYNYRFLVEYIKNETRNDLTRLQVNVFYDKPINDKCVADQYVWINVQDGKASSIQFGGRNNTPLAEMPDNAISFDDKGIRYDGWRVHDYRFPDAGLNTMPSYLYRSYQPLLNVFESSYELGEHTGVRPDLAPEQVYQTALSALSLIPTQDELLPNGGGN